MPTPKKRLAKSKTVWFNAIVLALALVTLALDHKLVEDEKAVKYALFAVAATNMVLRFERDKKSLR
jgi:hypothetical protein